MSGNAEASESNKSISDAEIRSDREVENVKYRSDLQSNRSDTQTTDDGNGTSSLSENVGDAIDRLCFQTVDRVERETVEVTTDSQNVVEKAGMEDPDGSQSQDLLRGGPLVGRTYTMKELLEELKEENPETIRCTEASNAAPQTDTSSYSVNGHDSILFPQLPLADFSDTSQEAAQQKYVGQSNVTIDLINSVTGFDEEAHSRQRTLSFAVKRYATAVERNPEDYDALYNWALVLQESADNVGPDSNSTSKDTLLEEACKKYDEATKICPTLHDAFYNWAIAISDRAKMRGRTKEAEEFWKQATNYYERAVQLNWNSPQALNNWGLALQEKQTIVRTAISKFRAAIRLQFDFHWAIYNLGTVLYGLAEDTLRTGRQISTKEIAPDDLYRGQGAPLGGIDETFFLAYDTNRVNGIFNMILVYRSALRLVHSMLPLPYLKVGYLLAPPVGNSLAPHDDWKRAHFVLNQEGLQQVQLSRTSSSKPGISTGHDKSLIRIDIADIISLSPCSDGSLPTGAGLYIDTIHGPRFFVAESWDSLDGWIDAIRLVYTIYARGRSQTLAGVMTS